MPCRNSVCLCSKQPVPAQAAELPQWLFQRLSNRTSRLSRIRIGSLTEQTHGIIVLTCRQGISHLLQQYICRLCQKRHRTQQESEEKKSQGFHFKVYIVKQPEISQ